MYISEINISYTYLELIYSNEGVLKSQLALSYQDLNNYGSTNDNIALLSTVFKCKRLYLEVI